MSALGFVVPEDLGFGAPEPPGPNLKSPFKARGFRSPTSWRWQVGGSPTQSRGRFYDATQGIQGLGFGGLIPEFRV